MPLETWVSVGSLLIATLTLATFTRSAVSSAEKRLGERIDSVEAGLSKHIDSVEAGLSKHIDSVEAGLSKHIASVEASLEKLDDRVYALATGMRPLLESTEKQESAITRRPA
ncbi:hypothetical protein GCM10022239_25490 [Leifsonia bigeumensis]|uniref:DUF2746 domain-containing protein n=1 Tax=Leifsonella bigeumensis TaxID=433643 RepID=A0ABP7FYC3_9MICO